MEVFSRKRTCGAVYMLAVAGNSTDVLRAYGNIVARRLHPERRHRSVSVVLPRSACLQIYCILGSALAFTIILIYIRELCLRVFRLRWLVISLKHELVTVAPACRFMLSPAFDYGVYIFIILVRLHLISYV